jgi:hypothetical protein
LRKSDTDIISVLCEEYGYAMHAGKSECLVNSGMPLQKIPKQIYGLKWKIYCYVLAG